MKLVEWIILKVRLKGKFIIRIYIRIWRGEFSEWWKRLILGRYSKSKFSMKDVLLWHEQLKLLLNVNCDKFSIFWNGEVSVKQEKHVEDLLQWRKVVISFLDNKEHLRWILVLQFLQIMLFRVGLTIFLHDLHFLFGVLLLWAKVIECFFSVKDNWVYWWNDNANNWDFVIDEKGEIDFRQNLQYQVSEDNDNKFNPFLVRLIHFACNHVLQKSQLWSFDFREHHYCT